MLVAGCRLLEPADGLSAHLAEDGILRHGPGSPRQLTVYGPQSGVGAGTTCVVERQRLLHLFEEVRAVGSGADVRAEIFRASDER